MHKVYLKQAFQILRQNKFAAAISILGTAFSVLIVMILLIIDRVENVSMAPESNRNRMMYIKYQMKGNTKGRSESGWLQYSICKSYLSHLKTPEKISFINIDFRDDGKRIAGVAGKQERKALDALYVDAAYWDIMSFDFLEGTCFSQLDYEGGKNSVVISQRVARMFFGSESAVGKELDVNFKRYKITGVVRNVPRIFEYTYSDIWMPSTSIKDYESLGYYALVLAENSRDFNAIREEVRDCEKRWDADNPDWEMTFLGPYDHRTQLLSYFSNREPDVNAYMFKTIFIVVIVLLVPILNLSGFSRSRIKKRVSEIGVRKAFGARKSIILIQVLYENMVTSLIGGLIGLVCSYLLIRFFSKWFLGVNEGGVPLGMKISLSVFAAVFLLSLLVNLLSAGIPAYKASRANIVESLKNSNKL